MKLLLLSFLLTYLVHSTLFAGGLWLLERTGRLRSLALREGLWRLALFGCCVSALLPFLMRDASWVSRYAFFLPAQPTPALETAVLLTEPVERAPASPLSDPRITWQPGHARALAPTPTASPQVSRWVRAVNFPPLLLLGTFAFALACLPRLRLWLWLGPRSSELSAPLHAEFAALCSKLGFQRRIRLTTSARIQSPIAFGTLRPEVCLPARAIHELDAERLRAVLAHELMHLARLDPLWLVAGEMWRRLFFFQPLAHLAQRRLVHLAELSCDRGAVELTGNPLALADSLAEVAGWIRAAPPRALCAMARSGSCLEERVRRLLKFQSEREIGRPARWLASAGALLTALSLPTFAIERARPIRPRTKPENSSSTQQAELTRELWRIETVLAEIATIPLLVEEQNTLRELHERAEKLKARNRILQTMLEEEATSPSSPQSYDEVSISR